MGGGAVAVQFVESKFVVVSSVKPDMNAGHESKIEFSKAKALRTGVGCVVSLKNLPDPVVGRIT
jgi:hypothetical protein